MFTPVIYFHKPSVLRDPFNKEIHKFQTAGLIDFWVRKYVDHRKMKITAKTAKLQLDNVIPIFEICSSMCVICFIVFILEIFSVKYNCVKSILDYFTY